MSDNAESKLARNVVQWLSDQHWEVYQEVSFGYGGVADIAAVRAGKLWIIECKTALTFKVLEQASRWRAHFRSIAIPRAKGGDRSFALHIAEEHLKIGVLEVDWNSVIEPARPPLMRDFHRFAKRMMAELHEEQKTWCAAGSSNGGYYTPYRNTMEEIKRFVAGTPGCSLKQIIDEVGKGHYSNKASAKSCIRTALENWETGWCVVEREGNEVRYSVKERLNER